MNLPISNVIKRLRREHQKTQEELACAPGVSYQAVSRWENGLAYPDIELLPKIASYFGITTDALFGVDKDTREGKLEWYWERQKNAENDEEENKILEEALAEFPDNGELMHALIANTMRMRSFYARPLDIVRLRSMVRHILEHSTDNFTRFDSLSMLIRVEDADRLEEWLKYLPEHSKFDRNVCLQERYWYRGEEDNFNISLQTNLLKCFSYVFNYCGRKWEGGRRSARSSYQTNGTCLAILDTLRDTTTDIDAWLPIRAFRLLRQAAGYCGAGLREEGYEILEKAVELYEKFADLPMDLELGFNTPMLDILRFRKKWNREWNSIGFMCVNAEVTDDVFCSDDNIRPIGLAYRAMSNPRGWEWFNSVREEERYKALLARIEAAHEAEMAFAE